MTTSFTKDISIIIVSWNVAQHIDRCLKSIFKYNSNLDIQVIVVDNASTDQTVSLIKREYPQVKLIRNNHNLGFAAANNQAVQQAQGEYLLFLNPDTEFIDTQSLSKASQYLMQYPQVGLMGWHVLNADKTHQIAVRKFPTLYSQIITLLKLNNIFPSLNKHYLSQDFDYEHSSDVDSVIGACMLMRASDYHQLGGLDNDYYIWFEEVDLCRRVWNRGQKVIYYADAHIKHYGGQSFKQLLSLKKQIIFNRSLLTYFRKHHPVWKVWVLKLLVPVNLLLTAVQQLLKIKPNAY